LLGNAYALLHPINFKEPFGLSVAESMMCGTPVVAFNRGSMPAIIGHEKTGFLVDSVDEAVSVLNNVRTIDRKYCRRWAEQNFSKEKMVDAYIEIYDRILGNRY
jgi:glycosyltransferase involved in cell wall biosynthesis